MTIHKVAARCSFMPALSILVLAGFQSVALAQPSIGAVVNAASNEASLAPGCWMTIYGTKLAPSTAQAGGVPLPTSLSGVTVSVAGVTAPLMYVSPTQINALVPFEISFSDQESQADLKAVAVSVTTAEGTAAPHSVFLKSAAPALYTLNMTGTGPAVVLSPSFSLLDTVTPKSVIVLYAAGLGNTDPPARSDSGGASSPPFNVVPASRMPELYIGEQKANILFAGLAPGFPGVYQLNVEVPEGLASDRLILRNAGTQSNITQIGIPVGQNVTNVTGSISSLFPSDGSDPAIPGTGLPYDFSLMPQVTRFSVSMDIPTGAVPFTVLAAGESGRVLVQIDPPRGTWSATLSVLDPPVRFGDFSRLGVRVLDYLSCSSTTQLTCYQLPGNVMPMSRMMPDLAAALRLVPVPNVQQVNAGVGSLVATGTLPAGGRFVIDSDSSENSAWRIGNVFAGIQPVPLGYFDSRTAPLRLYVDGKLVASKDVTYKVIKRP